MPAISLRFESVEGERPDGSKHKLPPATGLVVLGPVIPGVLTLLDDQLATAREGSDPVAGNILIDTGASRTCFDVDAAKRAGLPIVGKGRMSSATHDNHEVPLFAGMLRIAQFGELSMREAMGASLESQGIIALLGRDALHNCLLVYDGVGGSITLAS